VSILVLTGNATPDEVEQSPHRADYVFQSVADIIPLLRGSTAQGDGT